MSRPISLSEMLDARERRAAVRGAFFRRAPEGACLLQITVNMPGSVKNGPAVRDIFLEALSSVVREFPSGAVDPAGSASKLTGPEGFLRLHHPSREVKERICRLEEEHPLGRLWDLDVFAGPDRPVSRGDLGLEPRRCLLCDRPAHACARSRAHPLEEILARIERIHRNYSVPNPRPGI